MPSYKSLSKPVAASQLAIIALLPLGCCNAQQTLLARPSCSLSGQQDRHGRDCPDADNTTSGDTMSTLSEGLLEPQDGPSRKHRKQLTSTEYALQEIRCAYAYDHAESTPQQSINHVDQWIYMSSTSAYDASNVLDIKITVFGDSVYFLERAERMAL